MGDNNIILIMATFKQSLLLYTKLILGASVSSYGYLHYRYFYLLRILGAKNFEKK